MKKGISRVIVLILASSVAGCATSSGKAGSQGTSANRESSLSSYAWRDSTTKAFDDVLEPMTETCAANGATNLQIGACMHEKLLVRWPESQVGAAECVDIPGTRRTATCLLDFGFWNYISGLIDRPRRGNWATFDLNKNDLFVHWFMKMHATCDPSGTVSDSVFYPCADKAAKRLLSVGDEALDGCPEAASEDRAMICYWDFAFNKYVLAQLEKIDD